MVWSKWFKGIFFGVALLIVACDSHKKSVADLEQYIKEVGDTAKFEKIKPIQHRKISSVQYQSQNKRNPFQERSLNASQRGGAPNPLSKYALDKLEFKGVLTYGGDIYAIIRTPDGRVYEVKKGDRIGANDGQVVYISPTHIKVAESLTDEFGSTTKRVIDIRLEKTEAA